MDWMIKLNQAVDYIEDNLAGEIDYEQAAALAGASSYHFQRVFAYMAGVPLSEYIRRRRMTLAAVDLQGGGESVLDMGLKYGYSSPTAFNRAFQGVHGVTPSEAKKEGVPLKSFLPIRFKITIQGAEEMKYRIEKKEEFRIVGFSIPLSTEIEKNFQEVPQFWQKAATDGSLPGLMAVMNREPMGILGVSACVEKDSWRYYIAAASDKALGEGMEEYLVPAATWAIFEGAGTNLDIQTLEKRIFTEWLPTSGYEYGQAPDIEVYLNPDPQNAKFEVWMPVVKK